MNNKKYIFLFLSLFLFFELITPKYIFAQGLITTNDWATRGRTQEHNYSVPYDLQLTSANKLNLRWKRFLGERIEVEMEPVVVGNLVYVGVMNGKLYALNKINGNTVWMFDAGAGIPNTPTVAEVNGSLMIFFGSLNGKIYGLNATTGAKIWEFQTGDAIYATPNVANNTVMIGSLDKKFYFLNATNGNKIWDYETTAPISNTSVIGEITPGTGNLGVYVADGANKTYGFNINNHTKIWEFQMQGLFTKRTMAVYANGIVMFVTKKPGSEYSEHHEDLPAILQGSPKDGPTVINAWADYYILYPKRRPLYYLNSATGTDLWNPNVDKTKFTPLYIPYWGEYSPVTDTSGFAWFPASGSGSDHALSHDERLWKINLTTGEYTHIAYGTSGLDPSDPNNYFQMRTDEVGRMTLISGSTQKRLIQTISEDGGFYDINTKRVNTTMFGNGTYNHRQPLEIDEAITNPSLFNQIFGGNGYYKFFTRFGCSSPSCFGGGNDAISPLVISGNKDAFYISYGYVYAVTSDSIPSPIKNYGTLDLIKPPTSNLTRNIVKQELSNKIQNIISNGHMNPSSRFTNWAAGLPYGYGTFWHTGEVVYSLAEALPLLDEPLRTNLSTYLRSEVQNYLLNPTYYTSTTGCLNYETGLLETTCSNANITAKFTWNNPYLVMERLYAIYKYSLATNDWPTSSNWTTIKNFYNSHVNRSGAWDENYGFFLYDAWRTPVFYFSLQQGTMLAMREMANHLNDTSFATEAERKLNRMNTERIRWGKYVRNELYSTPVGDQKCINANIQASDLGTTYCLERNNYEQRTDWGQDMDRSPMPIEGYLDVTNNPRHIYYLNKDTNGIPIVKFENALIKAVVYPPMLAGYHPLLSEFVTPYKNELYDMLDDYMKAIERICPHWYMGDYSHCAVYGQYEEDSTSPLVTTDMFQVYAKVYQKSFSELVGYLPPTYQNNQNNDIFRIQNLVTLLNAPDGNTNPSPSLSPTTKPGDINLDNSVNSLDLKLILTSWLSFSACQNYICDLNNDNKINMFDAGIVINNWGR